MRRRAVYAFAQDKAVCSGAVGKAQAAKIAKIYELAAQNGAPIVGFFDSDGAKLGEGLDAMDAIAQLLLSSNNLSGVVPQIAVITGACVGTLCAHRRHLGSGGDGQGRVLLSEQR